MSLQVEQHVLRHSKAKGVQRFILMILAHHANKEDGIAWPSIRLLAKESGMSERYVSGCLKALEDSGEIIRDIGGKKNTKGGWASNIYQIVMEAGCSGQRTGSGLHGGDEAGSTPLVKRAASPPCCGQQGGGEAGGSLTEIEIKSGIEKQPQQQPVVVVVDLPSAKTDCALAQPSPDGSGSNHSQSGFTDDEQSFLSAIEALRTDFRKSPYQVPPPERKVIIRLCRENQIGTGNGAISYVVLLCILLYGWHKHDWVTSNPESGFNPDFHTKFCWPVKQCFRHLEVLRAWMNDSGFDQETRDVLKQKVICAWNGKPLEGDD